MLYNYFRDYDPRIGRYVESDPIGLQGGINTFGYVDSAPLGLVDPLGLHWEFCSGTGQLNNVSGTKRTFIGYGPAGAGAGANNPDMQCVPNVGPPPENTYDIGPPTQFAYGANAMKLKPRDPGKMCGRKDFWIHDRRGSIGCLQLDDDVLTKIAESPDRELRVRKKCSN
ncbi:RHS repeat-associated core domain-containing protein [Usitatibacter palustris]|nr:RHS repeat-associated core domain-containing protein [Usitatibacter palustris]